MNEQILAAFSCTGPAEALAGGEGRAVRAGGCVLKPVDHTARFEWACQRLSDLLPSGYRIATPMRSLKGGFVFGGWGATRFEPGATLEAHWDEKLAVARYFHLDLKGGSFPPMPPAGDRWTRAHAIAWQEAPLPGGLQPEIVRLLSNLSGMCTPLVRGEGVIHADICSNILFHPKLPPCVIDFSPAYGSTAYADAILVADAVAWEGAPLSLVERLPGGNSTRQHLLRAVNFRLITAALFAPKDADYFLSEYHPFEPLIRHIA